MERQIKAGVYQKLDKSKLPNLKNMDPDIMQRAALHDPNNEHSVVYMWGTTGVGFNPDKVKKAYDTQIEKAGTALGELSEAWGDNADALQKLRDQVEKFETDMKTAPP